MPILSPRNTHKPPIYTLGGGGGRELLVGIAAFLFLEAVVAVGRGLNYYSSEAGKKGSEEVKKVTTFNAFE